jgi:hypothetical protein
LQLLCSFFLLLNLAVEIGHPALDSESLEKTKPTRFVLGGSENNIASYPRQGRHMRQQQHVTLALEEKSITQHRSPPSRCQMRAKQWVLARYRRQSPKSAKAADSCIAEHPVASMLFAAFGKSSPVMEGRLWGVQGGAWQWRSGMYFLQGHWRVILWLSSSTAAA